MTPIETILPGYQTQATQATPPKDGSAMGKDEFLLLLVTQLKHQDPTSPMDGQQMAAQLAQFSSVEQLMNIDKTLAANGEMNSLLAQSVNSGVAAGLIGKTVEASGATVSWNATGDVPLHFELDGAADQATVTIKDASGRVVRELTLDDLEAGRHEAAWDGKNRDGVALPHGPYTISVEATGGKDGKESVAARTYQQGVVDRVTFGQDGIYLWIGDLAIPMGAVQSVKEA